MQITPGDAFLRTISGSAAHPRPSSQPVPDAPPQPRRAASVAAAARPAAAPANSPPPVDRAHSVERIAQSTVPRDVPRGSLIDLQV